MPSIKRNPSNRKSFPTTPILSGDTEKHFMRGLFIEEADTGNKVILTAILIGASTVLPEEAQRRSGRRALSGWCNIRELTSPKLHELKEITNSPS